MNKNILLSGVLMLLSSTATFAQSETEKNIVLLGAQKMSIGFTDTTFYVPILANQELKVESSADWIVPTIENNKRLKVKVATNLNAVDRSTSISISTKDGSMTRTFTIDQEREGWADYIPTDDKIKVASATASDSQSGEGIERTYDGNVSTLWHSPYNNNQGGGFPFELTYNFKDVDQIDYLRYVPRTSGGSNGNFKEVEIYVKCQGDTEYKKAYTGDWGGKGVAKDVAFDTPLKNPVSIKFKVLSGENNFASCAEMEFYKKKADDPNTAIFADELWSSLKPGTTQDEVNALTNPYAKFVAQQLLDDPTGFVKGRIQEYVCRLSPEAQSDLLNAPGKYYDHLQGVTGININKGVHGIAVSGLPDGESLTLKVVAWFPQELNSEGNGSDPAEYSYTLRNGINNIEYTSDYDGLAYIAYYSDQYPVDHDKYPNVKVHFINGIVNGYLSPDRSNEELDAVLRNATNRCIDLVGEKVHSVWQTSGVLNYCKDTTGVNPGYVQYMNVLDSLVDWEHELLGLKKYNRVPDNRTMAYVNYKYYMFQGYYGVSFKYDTESRVLNCKTITKNDGDAIWGLSHEWGHQHQMTPYFCWTGLSESSNNMNSCENVLRMGYKGYKKDANGDYELNWDGTKIDQGAGRIESAWVEAYKYLIAGENTQGDKAYIYVGQGHGDYKKTTVNNKDVYEEVGYPNGAYVYEAKNTGKNQIPEGRYRAYENKSRYSWCKEIQDLAEKQYNDMKDAKGVMRLPSIQEDALHALSTHDLYVEANTAAYYMLHNYFSFMAKGTADYKPDYQKDVYEALRRNDEPNGSNIEPGKTKVDKYELLAQAQNNNRNGAYEKFIAAYPNSVWTKNGYIQKTSQWTNNSVPFIFNYVRKASQICGYNLFHYFDKMGFFREAVMCIDDYGLKDYAMTKAMRDEFEEDMKQLNLPMLGDDKIEIITHADLPVYKTPNFPNAPVTKK